MTDFDSEFQEIAGWSDERLTSELSEAARNERTSLVALLLRLAEFIRRELSERKGYASAFDYCTRVLGYSRSGAYRRTRTARAALRYRSVLGLISRGEIHLTGVTMLALHLTSENHRDVLRQACGKSEDEIARIVAGLSPRTPPRDRIRIVSAPPPLPNSPDQQTSLPASVPTVGAPPAPGQDNDLFGQPLAQPEGAPVPAAVVYEVRFPASEQTVARLLRAQELLRHRWPKGDIDPIVQLALDHLLDRIDRDRKKGRTPEPEDREQLAQTKPGARPSRRFPEADKQQTWERDGGRCAYVGEGGVRCNSTAWLEFDHRVPYALGGQSDASNGRLYCRGHNQLVGRITFGGPTPSDRLPPA